MPSDATLRDPADSFRGIYCGACSIASHGKTGQRDGFLDCLAIVPEEDLACSGCTSDHRYAGCRVCGFRDCATSRGLARCGECTEYPCKQFERWQSISRLLPHVGEAAGSLATIQREGVDAWLTSQKKRWSCPSCAAPLSWYETVCDACGRDLAGQTHDMRGVRKLVCRLLLPLAYWKGKRSAG